MKRPGSIYVLLLSCAILAACGDSPTRQSGEPASLTASGSLPEQPTAGTALSPAVVVRDAADRPVEGVAVSFQVTAGGGSVSHATVTTNGSGIATLPSWTLGATPGVNTLVATIETLQPVSFSVTSCGAYCINIRFVGTVSASQQAAFRNARQRWEQIITGNLPGVQMNIGANVCKDVDGNVLVNTPAINELVDDLLVYVQVDSIDGPAGVLAAAGPCFIRNTSRLPVFGVMLFDRADLNQSETRGILGDVVLHELGHVLGFPAIWEDPAFNLLQGKGSQNPYFTGTNAASAFQLAGGTLVNGVGVPVENTGGAGTRDSHWREAVMSTELMTGFVSTGSNPLSAVTIGSLQDLGYQVNLGAADAYTLPGAGAAAGAWSGPRLEIIELRMPAPRTID